MRVPILHKSRAVVRIPCPVCNQGENTLLFKLGSSLFPNNISFCHFCGFIFQNPRPSEKEWNEYYSEGYYDKFHRPRPHIEDAEFKSDVSAVPFKRIKQYLLINNRRHGIVLKGNRVCEIGAGSGNVISTFDGNELYAIEPSEECRDVLKKKGISIVLNSIDQAKDSNYKFEIILIRHALEHVYYPKSFLKTVSNLLADKGIMYIAVPNILISNGTFVNMFTYPHISYFSIHTLEYLCRSIGYDVLAIEVDTDEIWCIISTGKNIQEAMENKQKDVNLTKNIIETNEILKREKYALRLLKRTFIRYVSNILPFRLQTYIYERRNS